MWRPARAGTAGIARGPASSRARFKALLHEYAGGYLHGPFNLQARLLAGFDEDELADLVEQAG